MYNKGDVRFAAFNLILLFMKSKGANFCKSMSDHIKQQVSQELFPKQVSFSWETAKVDSVVLQEWGNSVAFCFNLLDNVRYRTTERKAQSR